VTAPVCVADKDIGFVAVAAAAAVAGAGVVDVVAGCAVVVVAVATAAVAAVAAGPVFVAQCQPPRKKIRRGQRSRY